MNIKAVFLWRLVCLAVFAPFLLAPVRGLAFSIEQSGCVIPPTLPVLPPLPNLTGAKVAPENAPGPWTATFTFVGKGQTTVVYGCPSQGAGAAENIGYGISVEGRYGHGKAEEVVTVAIGKPTGTSDVQPWMGTHTFTTYLECPEGNPWLLGKPCKVTGTATPIKGLKFKGPFPITHQKVPAGEREQLLYKAFPPAFVLPAEKAKFGNGAPVTVQLAKSGPLAAQPVTLEFTSGSWAGAKTFKKPMAGSSLTVAGTAFGPGEWKITAHYAKDMSLAGGAVRTFLVQGEWGGGAEVPKVQKPAPGAEGPLKLVPVNLPPPTTRGR